jgi:type II secretory pathway pseudopilin PulG
MGNKDIMPKRAAGRNAGEGGYVLLAVLFMVAMVLILLSIAAPKMAADIERDREVEMVHRGKQYIRAIKLYYKKFGAYPPNMEALEKSNEIRFLRKRYKDPITGKDEWHLIHFGENKTPSYGFFGQPIGGTGGSTLAGVGPGGVGQNIGGPASSAFGSGSAGGGMFGSSPIGGGASAYGGVTTGTPGTVGTDPNSGPNAGTTTGTASATTGTGTATGTATGTGTDPNSPSGSTGIGSPSTFGGSTSGQTFGGGGIIGVESTSPKLAILEWKKKKHFNEWEFWYDPNADMMTLSNSSGAIGQPAGGAPGTGAGGAFGSSGSFGSGGSGGSSFGNGGSFGSGGSGGIGGSSPATPTPTPAPTQPQQPQQ